MGAQLNIKDAETVRLARQLADATGQSVTAAIRAALERELRENEKAKAERRQRVREIVKGSRELLKPEFRDQELSLTHGDLLYDEDGLPK
ncbi:type II toxin-antitoxin system VapB family antitoxin [Sphingomonas sp. LB-2]|uniref:type II toxin-antitoxin system VapB family antitoxin n=1 Tax=Sphingomonas caeni TaxID=2984949 RepID=UPI0022312948|nr:type II toxin-antitoxin system VapB family antitoxin [Sphingomonas caeni]MCW3847533.1 type II toxin-antitoxin system VapB family antitoxin [Sphingomonas caeni]